MHALTYSHHQNYNLFLFPCKQILNFPFEFYLRVTWSHNNFFRNRLMGSFWWEFKFNFIFSRIQIFYFMYKVNPRTSFYFKPVTNNILLYEILHTIFFFRPVSQMYDQNGNTVKCCLYKKIFLLWKTFWFNMLIV